MFKTVSKVYHVLRNVEIGGTGNKGFELMKNNRLAENAGWWMLLIWPVYGVKCSDSNSANPHINSFVQDCSISIVNELEIPQYWTKPAIFPTHFVSWGGDPVISAVFATRGLAGGLVISGWQEICNNNRENGNTTLHWHYMKVMKYQSSETKLFVQQLQVNNKENPKALYY